MEVIVCTLPKSSWSYDVAPNNRRVTLACACGHTVELADPAMHVESYLTMIEKNFANHPRKE